MPPEPLTRGLPPPDPRSLCPLSSTEFVETPLRTKFLDMPLLACASNSAVTLNTVQRERECDVKF